MEFNNTLYMQQLKIEMRKRGLNPKGLLMADYRNMLNFSQEKLLHDAKKAAEKRTWELQNNFSTMLGIDKNKLDADWIADAIRGNKKLAMVIRE